MKIKDITSYLEKLAPLSLQESYDNAGLLTGNLDWECSGAVVCLDAIEEVVDEAIDKGCNLIIAHHPIIFSGLKRITGKNYIERTIIKAIKNDLAIYAIHTNLDNVINGVNARIAQQLGIDKPRILQSKSQLLYKLISFVPQAQTNQVLQAMFDAGAGKIGNYSEASFSSTGNGTFKGNEDSNPTIGKQGVRESIVEDKIEVLVEKHKLSSVLSVLKQAHPYEEVAYDVIPLHNKHPEIGSGMIGDLSKEMNSNDFMQMVREKFQLSVIRHTNLCKHQIKTIAWCGGSGSFLLSAAKAANADVFITGDFKYHEFFDADKQLIIMDIGHYESEQYTSSLIIDELKKKFSKFAVFLTEVNTNPVQYFI